MRTVMVLTAFATRLHAQSGAPAFQLERWGCRGFCPAYTVAVFDDGRVRFEGVRHVQRTGTATRRISRTRVQRLRREFARLQFATLPDTIAYRTPECGAYVTDLPILIVSQTRGRRTHRVQLDLGCEGRPPAVEQLADMIDSTTGISRWIVTSATPSRSPDEEIE
jgi:hypothetical protein